MKQIEVPGGQITVSASSTTVMLDVSGSRYVTLHLYEDEVQDLIRMLQESLAEVQRSAQRRDGAR